MDPALGRAEDCPAAEEGAIVTIEGGEDCRLNEGSADGKLDTIEGAVVTEGTELDGLTIGGNEGRIEGCTVGALVTDGTTLGFNEVGAGSSINVGCRVGYGETGEVLTGISKGIPLGTILGHTVGTLVAVGPSEVPPGSALVGFRVGVALEILTGAADGLKVGLRDGHTETVTGPAVGSCDGAILVDTAELGN